MIDELEWVKLERPNVDPPSPEARLAANRALQRAIRTEPHRFPPRPRIQLGWLAPVAAGIVAAAVVALFLALPSRKPSAPAARPGSEFVFRAEPSTQDPVVSHAAISRAVSILRARLSAMFSGSVRVKSSGSEIFLAVNAGAAISRTQLLSTVTDRGSLVFYDWEANALTPSGKTVASLLPTQNATALEISQGSSAASPGAAGAGSMALYQAVKLASKQPSVSEAQCRKQGCARLGAEYFAFGAPGGAACPKAAEPCLLAGPQDSLFDLDAALPNGVSTSQAQVLVVPQGTVVLQAVPNSISHAPPWSSPTAQFYVLHDRVSLFGGELTNPQEGTDLSGAPDLTFRFTSTGATAFERVTAQIAHRGSLVSSFGQQYNQHFAVALDTQLITVPSIDYRTYPDGIQVAGGADITGGFTVSSARHLAAQLQLGPLPIGLRLISAPR